MSEDKKKDEDDIAEVKPGVEMVEKGEKKKTACLLPILLCLGICLALAAVLVPNFIRARARGQLTACKSNLKNIGTALEMYSTDWSGKYPSNMAMLTPNYLKTIPTCPAAGSDTYSGSYGTGTAQVYNTANFEDYYVVSCSGDGHTNVNVPKNFPQYDGLRGLYER